MSEDGKTRSAVVQESTRSLRVTIPQEVVQELGITPDEVLLFRPEGEEVRIRKAESVWEDA
jgi:bifunctional DNA-binding transcriptional regulator/antitoxin component of YhaV-PrlF toxin-antitoxin module